MNRKINISRVLVLIFVFSGVADFAFDCLASNTCVQKKSSNERPEFQRFLNSNSLPTESNFSRTKTETECEEEFNHDLTEFTSHVDEGLDLPATVVTIARRDISEASSREYEPVFLRNRQFRI